VFSVVAPCFGHYLLGQPSDSLLSQGLIWDRCLSLSRLRPMAETRICPVCKRPVAVRVGIIGFGKMGRIRAEVVAKHPVLRGSRNLLEEQCLRVLAQAAEEKAPAAQNPAQENSLFA